MNTISTKPSYFESENNPYVEEYVKDVRNQIDIEFETSAMPKDTGMQADNILSGSDLSVQSGIAFHPYFKQWEGIIISIEDSNCFLARIQEISGVGPQKIVRFDKRNVEFVNHELFAEGASFYWKVGLFYNEKRMAKKRSEIRFRLLPPPNPILIKKAEKEIGRIFDTLSWMD